MKPLIILDRDGVINEDSNNYIRTVEAWQPIDGSLKAIAQLQQAGFTLAIATNQSGIARGYYSLQTLHQMHDKMNRLLKQLGAHIEHIEFCPHGPDDNCDCRKPKPGLYHRIANKVGMPLNGAYVVGDSLRDLEAAEAVNATPILVLTGKGEKTKIQAGSSYKSYPNLAAFADALLGEPS